MVTKPKNHLSPLPEKGRRARPTALELRVFAQPPQRSGGFRNRRPSATKFAARFGAMITRLPSATSPPKWIRALIQKKSSVDEFATILHDRLYRAPTKANQELAWQLANEILRMKGGVEAVKKHLTPKLFARLSGKRGQ